MNKYWELFCSFFKIGIFTFGGGYAMIPIIQAEVITRKGWIKEQEFLDLLTLAQSAPGPMIKPAFSAFTIRKSTLCWRRTSQRRAESQLAAAGEVTSPMAIIRSIVKKPFYPKKRALSRPVR